ncbi:Seizure protein 6 [Channa argus]|uniref:Seizure protein 6 n=1 Tax=Channa argus TaxID=215402 RepID=A0A6G1PQV1_CHAAH|nr:Seizure protein 6 [Channa argus]
MTVAGEIQGDRWAEAAGHWQCSAVELTVFADATHLNNINYPPSLFNLHTRSQDQYDEGNFKVDNILLEATWDLECGWYSEKVRWSVDTSASEDGLSIALGSPPESMASLFPTTQDKGKRLPMVTTAPPLNVLHHHPLYRYAPQHQALLSPHSKPNYFKDSGVSNSHPTIQPTSSNPPPWTKLDNDIKRASDESAESSIMQTTIALHTLTATSYSHTSVSATRAKDPEHSAVIPSVISTGVKDLVRTGEPKLMQNMGPSSDEEKTNTTMTTIVTTMQSPVSCQLNLTEPEGYIEAPSQSCSGFHSTKDCSYIITVYMGYGVEVQVMNVDLFEDDKVVFEDLGHEENNMLANESILIRGLVVRSHSNQISIRFHSPRSQTGSVMLRYQVEPGEPPSSSAPEKELDQRSPTSVLLQELELDERSPTSVPRQELELDQRNRTSGCRPLPRNKKWNRTSGCRLLPQKMKWNRTSSCWPWRSYRNRKWNRASGRQLRRRDGNRSQKVGPRCQCGSGEGRHRPATEQELRWLRRPVLGPAAEVAASTHPETRRTASTCSEAAAGWTCRETWTGDSPLQGEKG